MRNTILETCFLGLLEMEDSATFFISRRKRHYFLLEKMAKSAQHHFFPFKYYTKKA